MILALETATNVCSVALKDAEGEVYEKRTEERGSHSEKLFLFIEELMKEHGVRIRDLEAFLVSEGPGSYTGLRIGASAVKGLLFQSRVPLFGANTLASFARAALEHDSNVQTIHSIIDARRVHVYHQQFFNSDGILSARSNIEVISIEKFETMIEEGSIIIGTGLARIDKAVRSKANVYDQDSISARSLIWLLEEDTDKRFIRQVDPEEFEPRYYTSGQI